MEYLISKLAPVFVYPLGFAIVLALCAAGIRRRRPRVALGLNLATAAVLWLGSIQPIASFLLGTLEWRYPPLPSAEPVRADAIVVLGGVVFAERVPGTGPNRTAASDRVWHAARLYREGWAPLVVCSGGSDTAGGTLPPEALVMAGMLEELGVPRSAIRVETQSRTTFENARNTRDLLAGSGIRRVLLVTSALHMPRAMVLFRQQGIEAVAAPADFNSLMPSRGVLDWLPSAEALLLTTMAVKEYLGLAYARWRTAAA